MNDIKEEYSVGVWVLSSHSIKPKMTCLLDQF